MPRSRSIALYQGIRSYLADCQKHQLAPNTLRWYSQKLALFRVYMAQVHHIASAGSVTYKHVQGYFVALRHEQGLSDATIQGHAQVLQSFFRWSTACGYTTHNPAKIAAALWKIGY